MPESHAAPRQRTSTRPSRTPAATSVASAPWRLLGGGTDGNERLTGAAGAVLLVLLAVIGVTILRVRQLLWVHLFVGLLLIGPLALKLATTGYRFARYYGGTVAYVRKGAPPILLRVIAPMVVITTLVVFVSGVALLFVGPSSRATLLPIHKISFFVWLAFTALHVLGHLPSVAGAVRADYGSAGALGADGAGRDGRRLALAGALVGGVVLAVLLIPQFGPWLSQPGPLHHH